MTVAAMDATSFKVGEPSQSVRLESLRLSLHLDEVLLRPRIGQIGEHLCGQRVDRGTQFAHEWITSERMFDTVPQWYDMVGAASRTTFNNAARDHAPKRARSR